MSLKLFRRKGSDIWYIRGTVAKQSVFRTSGTTDREKAERLKAKIESDIWERRNIGPRAAVTFEEAALSYTRLREPGQGERGLILRLAEHFAEARLIEIDQTAVDNCLAAILKDGAKPATRARMLSPLCAILNHAARRGWCDRPQFEKPQLPRQPKTRWLTPTEAAGLIRNAAPHIRSLLVFIIGTGARMAEALDLQWADVDMAAAKVVFRDTKSGLDRPAGMPPLVIAALTALKKPDERLGHVFRRADGEPYVDRERLEGGQIKTAFRGACRRAGLIRWESTGDKENQTTVRWRASLTPHDLRHTWATWFYAATRDPLLLKREGGWASLRMVERYAHLMPSNLVSEIPSIWGDSHPAFGLIADRAKSVQYSKTA